MKAVLETSTVYKLTLNEEEASWLRHVMQNPLNVENPAHEDPVDVINRRRIWEALQPSESATIKEPTK